MYFDGKYGLNPYFRGVTLSTEPHSSQAVGRGEAVTKTAKRQNKRGDASSAKCGQQAALNWLQPLACKHASDIFAYSADCQQLYDRYLSIFALSRSQSGDQSPVLPTENAIAITTASRSSMNCERLVPSLGRSARESKIY